jgi:HKD family nuclease
MDIEFIANDPRQKARPRVEEILSRGTDQLAIACAFCTAVGVKILLPHAQRLKNRDSFLVVSSEYPTDSEALKMLNDEIPGNLFLHGGAPTAVEKKNSAALMHSKVFYARAGDKCWLWIGSHNLTGTATFGGNCESAIILHGNASEKPFEDALEHLIACRDEASLFDPMNLPVNRLEEEDILAIHAEMDRLPVDELPWHIQLNLHNPSYNRLLTAPINVRLFLYHHGSLVNGWRSADPVVAYSGTLTGVNYTAQNPQTVESGVSASWTETDFYLTETRNVLVLEPNRQRSEAAIQANITIMKRSDPQEILLPKLPKVHTEHVEGIEHTTHLDPDVKSFFRPSSIRGDELVHRTIKSRRQVLKLPVDEIRYRDHERIREALGGGSDMPIAQLSSEGTTRQIRHPFILRTKYRIR